MNNVLYNIHDLNRKYGLPYLNLGLLTSKKPLLVVGLGKTD